MQRKRKPGLEEDLRPLLRLMRVTGMWVSKYYEENSTGVRLVLSIYALVIAVFVVAQYGLAILNLVLGAIEGEHLAPNTITALFFAHSITKYIYFALRTRYFFRSLRAWNKVNTHPLFAESNSRHKAVAVQRSRKLLSIIGMATLATVFVWTMVTFLGDSVRTGKRPGFNQTFREEIPRLLVNSRYPWDASEGFNYFITFIFQLIWLILTLTHANLIDVFFCCLVITACEQLKHLKEILRTLMELSASLDTDMPNAKNLFSVHSDDSAAHLLDKEDSFEARYGSAKDFNMAALSLRTGVVGPNGLTRRQELLVRSAIKYWVERHKHVVRYVTSIGETYGRALLMHMLTSTVNLTLLAYMATKIDTVDSHAVCIVGYLFYTLAQVFLFCIHGNELIEESSSVMDAAYSCHWYDGSEEAKVFVQIVCQQCQKCLSVSGAKFFTISLDLFASVLGAVVTYFMVLIQLK